MLRPRALPVAAATCAAASLSGSAVSSAEPASAQAAAQLAHHAALDARAALATPASSRRRQRLLTRATRRLFYAYALTARLTSDHSPAATGAAATFVAGAAQVARDSAALTRCSQGRLQALAVRALRRAAQQQDDIAFELTAARSAGSIEDLIDAVSVALLVEERLLAVLEATAADRRIARRHRAALEAAGERASAASGALRVALAGARRAVADATNRT